ncbi:MAG: thr operon leader peptide [Candidatus Nitrosopelagicus sp.]|nr:thr operon leader peptide [Candidatus Nitrosopelagicus sp.]
MNKYSIITVVAIIIIIAPFAYSGLNIIGANQLEYKWNGSEGFSFFAMSNNGNIEFCNSMPFSTSFEKFQITTFYDAENIGMFEISSTLIEPQSSIVKKGNFSTEEFQSTQHMFMTLDYEFDGGEIRVDPNKFIVLVSIQTPIAGIIPYSHTIQISGFELDQIMKNQELSCN